MHSYRPSPLVWHQIPSEYCNLSSLLWGCCAWLGVATMTAFSQNEPRSLDRIQIHRQYFDFDRTRVDYFTSYTVPSLSCACIVSTVSTLLAFNTACSPNSHSPHHLEGIDHYPRGSRGSRDPLKTRHRHGANVSPAIAASLESVNCHPISASPLPIFSRNASRPTEG